MSEKAYLIFDYGASHGRCLVAKYDGKAFATELIHEYDNRFVGYAGALYLDILRLVSELDIGLVKAFRKYPNIVSVGIDTWGCDFGLLDKRGKLLANPFCYRDEWRHKYKPKLDELLGEYEIFKLCGANTNPIMGLYHLYAMQCEGASELAYADKFLMLPDLLNYYLTGEIANEYTDATMSLMVDQREKRWQHKIMDALGIRKDLFSPMLQPGTVLGRLRESKCRELNVPSIPVVAVATHDTASAIAGVPLLEQDKQWAFISMGTWAIFGRETDAILTDPKTFESGFANQGGVEGKNNLVNLLTGLWIIQQCREYWIHKTGGEIAWDEVVDAARKAPPGRAFIDVQDTAFSLPSANMPEVVASYCAKNGAPIPQDMGTVSRVIYESMVLKFKECLENIEDITGKACDNLHIFGGGVQNKLLCQWIADALDMNVFAGPVETTSIGNLIMQMRALGDIASVSEGRRIALQSYPAVAYSPKPGLDWGDYYKRYRSMRNI